VSISLSPRKSPAKAAARWGVQSERLRRQRDSDYLEESQQVASSCDDALQVSDLQNCSPSSPCPYSRRSVNAMMTVNTPASEGAPIPTLEWSQRYEGSAMIPRAGKNICKQAAFRTQCSNPPPRRMSKGPVDVEAVVERLTTSPAGKKGSSRSPSGKRANPGHHARYDSDGWNSTPSKGADETGESRKKYEKGVTIPKAEFERHIFGSGRGEANVRASEHFKTSSGSSSKSRSCHPKSPSLSKVLQAVRSHQPANIEPGSGFTISKTPKNDLFRSMQQLCVTQKIYEE